MTTPEPRLFYEFGEYRLDPRRRVLYRADGTSVPLKSKVFDTLLYLVAHNGELLDKDALMQAVWPKLVVEESNLNKNISVLRQVLGETPDEHRFIVTEPGRGYRFVAEVRRVAPELPAAGADNRASNADPAAEAASRSQSQPAPSADDGGRTRERSWAAPLLGGVATLAVLALVTVLWARRPAPQPAELRLEMTTSPTVDPWSIAVSPDGGEVVFVALSDGRSALWLRPLNADRPQPIAGTDGASFPFWSPDGRFIGFFADGYLQRVEVRGGAMERLAAATSGQGGTWNTDGTLLFAPNRASAIVSLATPGETPTPATRVERPQQLGHSSPEFLPDGRHFLYFAQGTPDARGIYLGELGNLTARRLLDADAKGVYVSSGFLLFVRGSTLYAQPFNVSRLELSGAPFVVAESVMADAGTNWTALSASVGGPIVYRLGAVPESQLVWFDRSGNRLQTVGERHRPAAWSPSISPDQRRVAIYRTAGGNPDIWVLDTDRGVPSRFTFDAAFDNTPIWSPDGVSIVFASGRDGPLNIYRKAVTGAADESPVLSSDRNKVPNDWSRDGRFLLYRVTGDESRYDLYALSMEGEHTSFGVATTDFDERDAQFSPDGKWVAYQSNESGRFEIYVQPFPGPGGKTLVSAGGGAQVRWNPDGRELFYVSLDGRLMAVPIELGSDGQSVSSDEPVPLFAALLRGGAEQVVDVAQYAVSQDGQRFLMNTDATAASSSITVVLNWAPQGE